jgi:hypothetical protein
LLPLPLELSNLDERSDDCPSLSNSSTAGLRSLSDEAADIIGAVSNGSTGKAATLAGEAGRPVLHGEAAAGLGDRRGFCRAAGSWTPTAPHELACGADEDEDEEPTCSAGAEEERLGEVRGEFLGEAFSSNAAILSRTGAAL